MYGRGAGQADKSQIKTGLLNVLEPTDLKGREKTWVALGMIVAKRNTARLWKAHEAPTLIASKRDMDWCMVMERTIYESRGCPKK